MVVVDSGGMGVFKELVTGVVAAVVLFVFVLVDAAN